MSIQNILSLLLKFVLDKGYTSQEGLQEGRQEGIRILIEFCREMNCSREDTEVQVAEKFGLEQVRAGEYMKKYWKD